MAIIIYNTSTLYGVPATCQEWCFVGRALSGPSKRPSDVAVIFPVLGLRVHAWGGKVPCPGSHSEPGAGARWELCDGSQDTPRPPLVGFLQEYSPFSPNIQTCKYTL